MLEQMRRAGFNIVDQELTIELGWVVLNMHPGIHFAKQVCNAMLVLACM